MCSWISLLVWLSACVCCGSAEGDPLPAGLVELVRNSPIASIEDLQLLLFSDSVEEPEVQSTDDQPANSSYIRLPRSLEAQPAQQAQCKVRTEVEEVTRGMLDRSNANFLLWPPCVEVQRCSGCCNTKSLHCVPVLTHTRYLQVMRIQYINKRPHYDKAVVSVSDHVECRCEPAPRSSGGSRKRSRQGHRERGGKNQAKESLHRHDHNKHNQRLQLDDLLKGSAWQHDRKRPSGGWDDHMHHGKKTPIHIGHNSSASVQQGESPRGHHHDNDGHKWHHHGDNVKSSTTHHHLKSSKGPHEDLSRGRDRVEWRGEGHRVLGNKDKGVETQIHHPIHHRHDLSKMAAASKRPNDGHSSQQETGHEFVNHLGQTNSSKLNQSQYDNQTHQNDQNNQTIDPRIRPTAVSNHKQEHTGEPTLFSNRQIVHVLGQTEKTNQNQDLKDNPTEVTNQWPEPRPSPTALTNSRPADNETPGWDRRMSISRLEEERRELLLLHQRLDEEKERLQRLREEEGARCQLHPLHTDLPHLHLHTTTMRTDTTTQTRMMTTTPTETPTTISSTTKSTTSTTNSSKAPPRPPSRPHPHPFRRRKKHRKRISKAAMRAMLM